MAILNPVEDGRDDRSLTVKKAHFNGQEAFFEREVYGTSRSGRSPAAHHGPCPHLI